MNKNPLRHLGARVAVGVLAAGVGGVLLAVPAQAETVVATGNVNLRTGPGTDNSILTTIPVGSSVNATGETSGSWIEVEYAGRTGYSYGSYFSSSATSSSVTPYRTTTGWLNVRSGAGTGYDVVDVAAPGTQVRVTGIQSGRWAQVVWDGSYRWMSSSYLTGGTSSGVITTTRPSSGSGSTSSGTGLSSPTTSSDSSDERIQAVIDYARAQLGKDYVWGGEGPNGFDCSGLTLKAYQRAGISLPHYSGYQAQMGTRVSMADLEPGDLIFWYSPVSHVSLYIGNGQMIHAANYRSGVIQGSVAEYAKYASFSGARRLINN